MLIYHQINDISKMNFHTKCGQCGKELFNNKKLLVYKQKLIETVNKKKLLQSGDDIYRKKYETDCCDIKIVYDIKIDLRPKVKDVTPKKDNKDYIEKIL